MPEDLLDISRKAVEDAEGVIRNLQNMKELFGVNQVLRTNALGAAEDALAGLKKLNDSQEVRDAAVLAGLLTGLKLTGDLSVLEQMVAQELESIKDLAGDIRSPQIDKKQIKQILGDLEAEMRQMQNAAVRRGIGVLATIARVVIPFL
jgi:hypothetical protein